MSIRLILICLVCIVGCTSYTHAASDDFTVQLTVTGTSTPTPTSTPTTTPETEETNPSSSGSSLIYPLYLTSFSVAPLSYSATFNWTTNEKARYELRWGKSTDYELGYISSDVLTTTHRTVLFDLQPSTAYYYELTLRNTDGFIALQSRGQFTTRSLTSFYAPLNVSYFQATPADGGVQLTWELPDDPDFAYVRIVRSDIFYPTDPNDGYVIYQGDGTSFFDSDQATDVRFYTAFSYDTDGNISSGATAEVYFSGFGDDFTPIDLGISIRDVTMLQQGIFLHASPDRFFIDAHAPFTIQIPYKLFPEHLKTIQVTFTDPLDATRTFSFLLRVNKDKTMYEAIVAPLSQIGTYPVLFSVYDFNARTVDTFSGFMVAQEQEMSSEWFGDFFPEKYDMRTMLGILALLLLPLLLLLLFIFLRRRKKDTEIATE